jgi:hypothetical protein
MTERVYVFAWGNNPRRATLKGRLCVIEAHGRLNSVLVRFLDTDERLVTSQRALRESPYPGPPLVVFRPSFDQLNFWSPVTGDSAANATHAPVRPQEPRSRVERTFPSSDIEHTFPGPQKGGDHS